MIGKKGFKELRVWQKAKDLAVYIYTVTNLKPFRKDYSLRDQMRRAAVSVPSNIAEGDERNTDKDAVRFLYIAKGSLAELRTQVEIANEIGYISEKIFNYIDEECIAMGKMIGKLIQARSE